MQKLSEGLIQWYKKNKRDLPWRHTTDPYKIWLSEIILQQTQVVQGLAYYNKFVEKYPTVKILANAPIDEVLKLWQGLGYYSRARNLHEAARHIVAHHRSVFPKTYAEIKKLKGVGDYTAAAIASIAYGLPHAVVDGNVYRVLSRVFNINKPIDTGEGKKYFQELATKLLPPKKAAEYNQAIMEFGALHCRPVANPDCESCVLNAICLAYPKKKVSLLPVKSKKTKVTDRYLHYFVFKHKDAVYIKKRHEKDIWQGLYEFYLIEKSKKENQISVLNSSELKPFKLSKKAAIKVFPKAYKHILSHQRLYARFYMVEIKDKLKVGEMTRITLSNLDKYPFPRLIEKFLNEHFSV